MTTIMTIVATIVGVGILTLTWLALGLARHEDKRNREYREKVDAIIEHLGLGVPGDSEQGEGEGGSRNLPPHLPQETKENKHEHIH